MKAHSNPQRNPLFLRDVQALVKGLVTKI